MTVRAVRYRAVLAYDGSNYYGFQRQAGDTPTIQGEVEQALTCVTGQTVTLTGAGRTDTGVHARGQVIAFDVVWQHTPDDLMRALNANLPEPIALQTLDVADANFHPRFDARSRAYEYTMYLAPVRLPCLNTYAWHVPYQGEWNLAAMQAAAAMLIGEHDFATFGSPPQGENTIRHVFDARVEEHPGPTAQQSIYRVHVEANAFLYRMMRRLVGALVRVGSNRLSVAEFAAALEAAQGAWPNQAAPARGLCLTKVTY